VFGVGNGARDRDRRLAPALAVLGQDHATLAGSPSRLPFSFVSAANRSGSAIRRPPSAAMRRPCARARLRAREMDVTD